ncbi:MAG: YerC/YecD family TrpR-related protein [Lachnospiraceae bacterium]|nr:YerC/YecD family TrpR-related protein [Lachnospiraceae bacterium]
MSRNLHTEEMNRLFDGILTLKNREEAYSFFEDLCTAGELEAMQQRFEVASMLRDKNTYSEIADKTGASTATISRVNRALLYGDDGYELVFRRLEEK